MLQPRKQITPRDAVPALTGLAAAGPDPELAEEMMLFGQFVGSWDLDAIFHRPGSAPETVQGEWHFGWTLDGRAIQDVWITPTYALQQRGVPGEHGLTVRFYDAKIDAWRVVWAGPRRGNLYTFVARKAGDEIVLAGTDDEGQSMHWIFSEITAASFRWRNVVSTDGGKTWRLVLEMFARRAAA
jgi:hypothetical protein